MKFRYPLQKIVDLKNTEKTQAEWLLSQALGRLREEEQFLSDLHNEKGRQQEMLSRSSDIPTAISEIQYIQAYINYLELQIERKQKDVRTAQSNVANQQQFLLERSIDEKVWTKAREKALHQFSELMQKKDQQVLDEMASGRHIAL